MKPLRLSLFKLNDAVSFDRGSTVFLVQSVDEKTGMVRLRGWPLAMHESMLSLVEALSSPSIKTAKALVSKAERHAVRIEKQVPAERVSYVQEWAKAHMNEPKPKPTMHTKFELAARAAARGVFKREPDAMHTYLPPGSYEYAHFLCSRDIQGGELFHANMTPDEQCLFLLFVGLTFNPYLKSKDYRQMK